MLFPQQNFSRNLLDLSGVNGKKAGEHTSGHLPFTFKVTGLVKFNDENVIALQVENHLTPTRVPSGNIGGMNLRGVFTRTRTLKLAVHVLREH